MSQNEWQTILLTVRVAGLAVVFAFPVAFVLAALLAARVRFHQALHALVCLPLVLPSVATGWLLLTLCGAQGPVGMWLGDRFDIHLAFTTEGAALACAVMVLPLMVRGLRLGLEAVDPEALAVASTLGAGASDRFFSIAVPLAWPGFALAVVTGFTASLAQFGAVITFAASIPGQTQTLPLAIYAALQTAGGAQAARLSLVAIGLAMFGALAADRLNRRLTRQKKVVLF